MCAITGKLTRAVKSPNNSLDHGIVAGGASELRVGHAAVSRWWVCSQYALMGVCSRPRKGLLYRVDVANNPPRNFSIASSTFSTFAMESTVASSYASSTAASIEKSK